MKAPIGVDAEWCLVHTVRGTSCHVNDVIKANALLHGEENDAFGETPDVKASGSARMPQAK